MSAPAVTVLKATCCGICRCGSRHELGFARVRIGEVTLTVTLTGGGVQWPHDVELRPGLAAALGHEIEREWLRQVGEEWHRARTSALGQAR